MACKLAPVVADNLRNGEWIEDRVNGFLFPPRNDAAFDQSKTITCAFITSLRGVYTNSFLVLD